MSSVSETAEVCSNAAPCQSSHCVCGREIELFFIKMLVLSKYSGPIIIMLDEFIIFLIYHFAFLI